MLPASRSWSVKQGEGEAKVAKGEQTGGRGQPCVALCVLLRELLRLHVRPPAPEEALLGFRGSRPPWGASAWRRRVGDGIL